MSLTDLLQSRRPAVLKDWFARIMAGYPNGGGFLSREKDRFANPLGGTIREGTEALLDALLAGADRAELSMLIDPVVRIRAVQEMSPSEAVSFVFLLKPAVRKAIAGEIRKGRLADELAAFESRIDEAALTAFDGYMGCREQLLRIRSDQVRNRTWTLLSRAGMVVREPEGDSPSPDATRESEV